MTIGHSLVACGLASTPIQLHVTACRAGEFLGRHHASPWSNGHTVCIPIHERQETPPFLELLISHPLARPGSPAGWSVGAGAPSKRTCRWVISVFVPRPLHAGAGVPGAAVSAAIPLRPSG